MDNVAKWAQLTIILLGIAAIITGASYGVNLLIAQLINGGTAVNDMISVWANALYTARGLVNCFTIPWLTSSLINCAFFMFGIKLSIKTATFISRYIFK